MGFFKYSLKKLLESFKFRKNNWYALGFQVLVLLAIFGVFFLYLFYAVMPFIDNLQQQPDALMMGMEDPSQLDEDTMEQQMSIFNWFIFQTILAVIGAIAAFLFLTYFVWNFIKKSTFKMKYLLKHFLVNVSIFLFVVIVGLSFINILQPWIIPFFVIFILLPLYIHLATLLNSSLEKKPLEEFIEYGIKKIHYFIFSHIIILVLGVLVFFVLLLGMTFMMPLQTVESDLLFYSLAFISYFVLIVIFSLYLVWAKNYVWKIFKGLKRDS